MSYSGIEACDIVKGMDKRVTTPTAANNWLKAQRGMWSWAKTAGYVSVNPAAEVKRLKVRVEGFKEWTLDDLVQYQNHWAMGTRERLALELLFWTGLLAGVMLLGSAGSTSGMVCFI